MERRNFLKKSAVAGGAVAAVAAGGLAAPAIAQKKRQLKMTLAFPKGFPGYGDFIVNISKRIEAVSDGKISIKVFGAGELVGFAEGVDAVGKGVVDMYYAAPYVFQAKSKAFNFFTTMPFGMTTLEHFAWMTHGGGEQMADWLHAKFNVKPFMCGQTYMQWGGWFNKKIDTVEDLRGLKIRITGLGGEVYKRMGATPLIMSVRESQPAMASGVVDAIEMNGPWVDQIMGFQKLAKYYYYPGWQEPTTNMNLGMNLELWNSFSKADQAKLKWTIESGIISNFGRHYATTIQQLNRLRTESPKVQILPFPDDVLLALGKTTTQLYADLAAGDPDFKKVWDSYLPFLKGSIDLTGKTDQPFINARARVFA